MGRDCLGHRRLWQWWGSVPRVLLTPGAPPSSPPLAESGKPSGFMETVERPRLSAPTKKLSVPPTLKLAPDASSQRHCRLCSGQGQPCVTHWEKARARPPRAAGRQAACRTLTPDRPGVHFREAIGFLLPPCGRQEASATHREGGGRGAVSPRTLPCEPLLTPPLPWLDSWSPEASPDHEGQRRGEKVSQQNFLHS